MSEPQLLPPPVVFVDSLFTMEARGVQAKRTGARHAHRWCHMWSDDLDALHAMARKIGLKREWFQDHEILPHYDLVPTRRAAAIALGAIEKDLAEVLRARHRARRATA